MKIRSLLHPGWVRYLTLFILFITLLVPSSVQPVAQALEVIVEDPQLHPAYTTCAETYWYPFANNRGHTAYLTLNASDPSNSTNHGEWHPVIPQSSYYRVQAYIAAHSAITWCTGQGRTISHDTTEARYSIHHANGVTTRFLSQYPLSNQWLDLGEYYFKAGSNGYVGLADLNGEAEFSTTISFSAMRFTFTRFTRPNVSLPLVHYTKPSGPPPPNAGVIQAQGFDACILPKVSQMQTWWNKSPYSFYGLYLGGIHLPSVCGGADPAWVSAVHQQGWSFIPTWVGPQAPCTQYLYKMSADPAVSYQEGRQEAQAASAAAASLGLTNYGWGGTIIYYDLEPYGVSSPECRQPVSAFMNGWVERLHELGNLAGGYGSRNSYPADWATIPNVPNDVWAASWYTTNYDPGASVYGITWLEGLWTSHQRIRQYAGDINNSWGGVSLNIDIDVADGVVALPPSNPLANPIVTTTLSIEDVGWLSADMGWLVSRNHLFWTSDQGKNWQDLFPGSIQKAYFLASGQAWAISAQNQDPPVIFYSPTWEGTWERFDLDLPPDGHWRPVQLQFSSPTSGWVVFQKETSQAFDSGILLKTSDGGRTWQRYDLPFAAAIHFSSQSEGWMINRTGEELSHTLDGGITWQPEQANRYPLSQASLPEGAILSGWGAEELGWAVTNTGSCTGEKSTPGFACLVDTSLWQSLDGGQTWQDVPLPLSTPVKP